MQRVRATLPQVSACPGAHPRQCLYCKCDILHKHGEVRKRVKDIYVLEDTVIRYRGVGCKRALIDKALVTR